MRAFQRTKQVGTDCSPRLLPLGLVMFPVVMALGLGFEGWRLAQMGVLAHSMMNLLDIDWPGHRPDRDVLDPAYRWVAPALPASIQPLR